jgi:hypothetical protein
MTGAPADASSRLPARHDRLRPRFWRSRKCSTIFAGQAGGRRGRQRAVVDLTQTVDFPEEIETNSSVRATAGRDFFRQAGW